MDVRYFKEWSRELDRDMEFKVYGDKGKVCFAFPPQNGRFWDFENFGMVECMRPWIEDGRIMLVCADGIDGESWSAKDDSPRHRIEMQEKCSAISRWSFTPEFMSWAMSMARPC